MPRTDWGWMVTPEEMESWVVRSTSDLLVLNKPAHLVCHPSKKGPWSSLIGACREYFAADRLHMVSRLDRETSGVVVMARSPELASVLQSAVQQRTARKTYLAIVEGILNSTVHVNQPIGADLASEFVARQAVTEGGRASETVFEPLSYAGGYTLVNVIPVTGRRHQIRVHSAFLGHPIVGDKLYGRDPSIMLRFIAQGVTPDMLETLKLDRHALHAVSISFPDALPGECFSTPLAAELMQFWRKEGGDPAAWQMPPPVTIECP